MRDLQHSPGAFPNVSARWLLAAAGIAVLGAIFCAWLTLCLLYWQGSWQLLYHPKSTMIRTPASVGIAFEPVHFAATETGTTRLTGWWIPNQNSRFTVLYLHGSDGNLSDSVDPLAALHRQNLAVFAIDFRGYGQSQSIHDTGHPGEKQLRQDTEWALTWLTLTRNIPAKSIVVFGSCLGANLAAELAADHSELAGVILDQPIQNPMAPVFNDSRSRLVPAHWLVHDRFDLSTAALSLRVPSLWLMAKQQDQTPAAYQAVPANKTAVWLIPPTTADAHFAEALQRWLDDLQNQLNPIPGINPLTR
ncbi:alpha/beta hydrolase [Acidicapsa acidisoli]|uniref:alpha/beta hydrolase n=1 Tax=Acidicapsa acidisoli TaxID=1615681 RepID=UPI0021DF8280|nr:alpha/beta fold hydrolase [Acidicapsa acidisoli]